MNRKHLLPVTLGLLSLFLFPICCTPGREALIEDGVPQELAQVRKASLSKLKYDVSVTIPQRRSEAVSGTLQIAFDIDKPAYGRTYSHELYLDYKGDSSSIRSIVLNGSPLSLKVVNEHIALPLDSLEEGSNTVAFDLDYGDISLNRNEDFLYTLLVPDRARTLMPCFDQPDLKALFTMKMTVPAGWQALTNSPLQKADSVKIDGRDFVAMQFGQSEPLSTYLFSFVAGRFFVSRHERDGREIHIYHREADPRYASQLEDIADQVFASLAWMEEYTGIPYPFEKYDLALIPGFQFGGMEHTGATLYNEGAMFLPENPTLQQELRRATLIAHETTHMWFGDYVTMKWFNEVWVKEVFANYFAMQMIRPMYPGIDFKLNDLTFYTRAYEEDRTAGTNPIQQVLPNLKYAGLIYGNIIYQKSPVVMDMLCRKMGPENFRNGMRDYLRTYAYGNASYDDLIAVLERNNEGRGLKEWSDYWVYGKGMPRIDLSTGLSQQQIAEAAGESFQTLRLDTLEGHVIPNADAEFYGYIALAPSELDYLMERIDTISQSISSRTDYSAPLVRRSLHMTLYENWLNGRIRHADYLGFLIRTLAAESDPQVFPQIPSAMVKLVALSRESEEADRLRSDAEHALWNYFNARQTYAVQALKALLPIVDNPAILEELYRIWSERSCNLLGERDETSLSYYLALNLPGKDRAIIDTQYSRLSNPDRKAEYAFVSQAAFAGTERLDSIFDSLTKVENRAKEPWVKSVLLLMNHLDRVDYTVKYIRPALELLPEIQRTGDIFFPKNWVEGVLYNHTSQAAHDEVEGFLADHPDLLPLMRNKILQSEW